MLAVLAGAATAFAQGGEPATLSVSPSSAYRNSRVTISGTGWGANLGETCKRIRVIARRDNSGFQRQLTSPIVGPPNTTFSTRVRLNLLPAGSYTLKASQSCTSPNGAGVAEAIAKLTVK